MKNKLWISLADFRNIHVLVGIIIFIIHLSPYISYFKSLFLSFLIRASFLKLNLVMHETARSRSRSEIENIYAKPLRFSLIFVAPWQENVEKIVLNYILETFQFWDRDFNESPSKDMRSRSPLVHVNALRLWRIRKGNPIDDIIKNSTLNMLRPEMAVKVAT